MSKRSAILFAISFCSATLLSGCGMGVVDHSTTGSFAVQGVVFGGQQPVTDAKIQLYTVGSSGNASLATPMIPVGAVKSGYGGNFNISGEYNCGESNSVPATAISPGSDLVYIVATDGNPGLSADNPQMVLMAALGPCTNLATAQFIEINEVTTAAAVWALAPFITSYTNVGATSTNTSGITNAFLDAGLLADTSTGLATVFPSGSNLAVETNKLYALANSIASCVNSEGGGACSPLFAAATSTNVTAPTDTLTAALNIVKNPGVNVAAVYAAKSGFAPFPSAYKKAPNDWTMSLTMTGGGLSSPTALGIDAESNVWVAGQDGPLSAFKPQGAPLSALGFGITNNVTDLTQTYGLTIDSVGDIWITNYNSLYNYPGSVVEFLGSNTSTPGAVVNYQGYYSGAIQFPTAVAADTSGNIYIAMDGSSSATVLTSNANYVTNLGGDLGLNSHPDALAVDSAGGVWLPDSGFHVAHISAGDVLLSDSDCCYDPIGVATDKSGNLWVANFLNSTFSELLGDGAIVVNQASGGGLDSPDAVVVDAAQNAWFANLDGNTISEIAGSGGAPGAPTAGTPISPSASIANRGGYGLDAQLADPYSVGVDRTGNVWVSNYGSDTLTMFFGLATPTVTPVQPVPTPP